MKKAKNLDADATAVIALLSLIGCAQIGARQVNSQEVVLKRHLEEVPDPNKIVVTAEPLDSVRLRLKAVHVCRRRVVRDIGRTNTWERYNATPETTWTTAAVAGSAIGIGAYTLVDASNVYDGDEGSRTYNPVGSTGAQAIGATVLTLGVIAGTATVIDLVKAQGREDKIERDAVRDVPAGLEGPCTRHPAHAELRLADYPLGTTDYSGELTADLNEALPEDFDWTQKRFAILYAGEPVGEADVSNFYAWKEAQAWTTLPLADCTQPKSADACEPVRVFTKRYPDGQHASEARRILFQAAPELHRLADEEAWNSAYAEGMACRDSSFETPEDGEIVCAPYRVYLEDFPKGLHVEDARRIETIGTARIGGLYKAREAARLKEVERLQAERKRQEQEAEAEARKEAKAQWKQCAGDCKVGCSGWQIADRKACYEGCVEGRCAEFER